MRSSCAWFCNCLFYAPGSWHLRRRLRSSCVGGWQLHGRPRGDAALQERKSEYFNFCLLLEEKLLSARTVGSTRAFYRTGSEERRRAGYEGKLQVGTWSKQNEKGQLSEAVDALDLLVRRGSFVENSVLAGILKRCIAEKNLALCSRVHAVVVKSGYESNPYFAHQIMRMYVSHGRLEEATQVFTKVVRPDTYMWASIIMAHARHGQPTVAIRLYRQMRRSPVSPDNHIFVAVLTACATAKDLPSGREVHYDILGTTDKPNLFVGTSLINMYAKCSSLEDARKVFDNLPSKNVVAWNAMITGYAQHGLAQETLALYSSMQQEGITPTDAVSFICLLQACASIGALREGKQLHAQIRARGLEADVVVGNCLVNMYAKCRSLEDARDVFQNLSGRDVVTWNAMIAGYAQSGQGQEALTLYGHMQLEGITPADAITYVSVLQACSSVAGLEKGKEIHAQICKTGLDTSDVFVANALIDMYSKCGSLADARRVFDRLPSKDVVTWTAMIAGYAQHGRGQEALSLYESMQQEGITPANQVTFVCLLQACGSAAQLDTGKELHALISKGGLDVTNSFVASTLIDMYGKCGSMSDAQKVFDALPTRDIVAWNALLAGYVRQADSDVVFDLFQRMLEEGTQPNGITFLSVLSICSHVGLVDKGRKCFKAMSRDYGITPTAEHYNCMVDLFGRAGHLAKAMEVVKTMPFQAHREAWRSVLASCRKWGDVELAREAFECAVRLDESDAAPYVMMSSIYAAANMREEAKEIRSMRLKAGARKEPGQSWWTDDVGVLHTFGVGE